MMKSEILQPVVVLIAWTLVMLVWMMLVRGPAMKKAGLRMGELRGGAPGSLDKVLDEPAQWPAHNYIHLHEQPTIFYAVALVLAISGQGDGLNATIAWHPFDGNRGTSLTLSANNILDVDARRHASVLKDFAPLAGRDIRVTARFQL